MHPEYRHRRIQGALQSQGVYLSASVIYEHLRHKGWVQAYERRAAPWKDARYEVWQRNLMWGCDWSKLLVGGVRWYLLTVIDFFSRLMVALDVVPTVHAGHVTTPFGDFIIARHTSRSPWLITALPHRDAHRGASVLDSARMTVVMAQNQAASSSGDAEKEIARKSSNL